MALNITKPRPTSTVIRKRWVKYADDLNIDCHPHVHCTCCTLVVTCLDKEIIVSRISSQLWSHGRGISGSQGWGGHPVRGGYKTYSKAPAQFYCVSHARPNVLI